MGEHEEVSPVSAATGSTRAATDDLAGKSRPCAAGLGARGGSTFELASERVRAGRPWCVPGGRPRRVVSDLLRAVGLTDHAQPGARP